MGGACLRRKHPMVPRTGGRGPDCRQAGFLRARNMSRRNCQPRPERVIASFSSRARHVRVSSETHRGCKRAGLPWAGCGGPVHRRQKPVIGSPCLAVFFIVMRQSLLLHFSRSAYHARKFLTFLQRMRSNIARRASNPKSNGDVRCARAIWCLWLHQRQSPA